MPVYSYASELVAWFAAVVMDYLTSSSESWDSDDDQGLSNQVRKLKVFSSSSLESLAEEDSSDLRYAFLSHYDS